ncbi:TPA: hypothetical protein DCF80_01900 [Candidatus Saccharibacteria bacterium]|nr:hypothetical protein [Candidatus Saccharibacteria bacterium]HRK40634.1 hypothetical protein [Candidatus Saccharibacteria bacterium]
MKRGSVLFRLSAGLLTGLLCFTSLPADAATPTQGERESITMSPTSKHYDLKAGGIRRDELTIVNDGETDYAFRVYAAPYSVQDENYEPDFSTMRQNTDIESWIDFEKRSYFVRAGETVTVKYTVAVPENATPGGHYGVLFAETQPTGVPTATSVERKKRVGAIVYATVDGEYQVGGKMVEFDLPGLQFVSPLKAMMLVENTGNADFAVNTRMLVTDLFGNKKYEVTKTYQVLPASQRKITMDWPQSPSFGLFKVTASAEFLGQDTAKEKYVLMAPVWMYLAAVIGLLVLIIYYVQKRR